MGNFSSLNIDINSMIYKQEVVKGHDKVITRKNKGKLVWRTSVP